MDCVRRKKFIGDESEVASDSKPQRADILTSEARLKDGLLDDFPATLGFVLLHGPLHRPT